MIEPITVEFVAPEPSLVEAPPDDAIFAGLSAEVPLHASLEAKTDGDASMSIDEHLQQLLRAAEERKNQENEDAAVFLPQNDDGIIS